MPSSIDPVQETLKELEDLITHELVESNTIDTPLTRHDLLTELVNEMKAEMPDTLAKRAMLAIFDWYLENLLRESRFEDPIPME